MIDIKKMKVQFKNFYKNTEGQRDYPYVFFYLFPLFAWSQTNNQDATIYFGWLWFVITFKYKLK